MTSWVAAIIALLSLVVSVYTLWRTHLASASLVVMPPAISQANDGLPSLIVDLSILNDGAKPSVLSDLGVRLLTSRRRMAVFR
jgi:hypothetical protein